MTLYDLSADMMVLEQRLEDNGGEMDEQMEALYEETSTGLANKVDDYKTLIIKLQDRSEAIANEIRRLQSLKKVNDNSLKSVKAHILNAMQMFGMQRLEGNYCKVFRRKSKALDVDEEQLMSPYSSILSATSEQLPEYITLDIKVNKTILKELYKGTDVLPQGAAWSENESITLK